MTEDVDLSHLPPEKRKTALAIIATRDAILEEGGRVGASAIASRIAEFHPSGRTLSRRQIYDDDYIELWNRPSENTPPDAAFKRLMSERNRLRRQHGKDLARIKELEATIKEQGEDIAKRIAKAKEQDEQIQVLLAGYVEDAAT